MTTAVIDWAATPGLPSAPAMPAAANGTSMKPPCATDEYASMRTMFVWRSAARFPSVIDATASTQITGHHASVPDPFTPKNPKKMMLRSATNPPAFDATDRYAVTGVGAPSYVSGAQKWNGTALTLNANPTSERKIAMVSNAGAP